jgi:hypothetical protein
MLFKTHFTSSTLVALSHFSKLFRRRHGLDLYRFIFLEAECALGAANVRRRKARIPWQMCSCPLKRSYCHFLGWAAPRLGIAISDFLNLRSQIYAPICKVIILHSFHSIPLRLSPATYLQQFESRKMFGGGTNRDWRFQKM